MGLPVGLSVSIGGQISGNPFTGGSFPNVVISVTDTATGQMLSKTFAIYVAYPQLQISGGGLLGGVALGTAVSRPFTAAGGDPPYSWTGAGLPAGLSIDPNTGVLGGTASQPGLFSFSIVATDQQGASASTSATLSILGITTTSLPNASTTTAYTQTIGAAGGTPPYSFSATGVPAGLTLSVSGVLSGTAKLAGSYSIGIQATDSAGYSVSASLSLKVTAPLNLTVSRARSRTEAWEPLIRTC